MVARTTGEIGVGADTYHQRTAKPVATIAVTNAIAQASRRGAELVRAVASVPAVVSTSHLSWLVTSRALCQRSSGSFARHFFAIRSRSRGVSGCRLDIGGGSACMIAPMRLA